MTDDEINERVARIEGWTTRGESPHLAWYHPFASFGEAKPPDYATDWAWCGPLIELYNISVGETEDSGMWSAIGWQKREGYYHPFPAYADTPQRAICLALIALHEGKE